MYLVQRCAKKFKVYTNQTVSEAFSLDYMGSAEFEFGAIPKSIRKMAQKNLVQTSFKFTNHKGHDFTIHVLADHEEQGEAVAAIRKYLDARAGKDRNKVMGKMLKEWISIGDIVAESEQTYTPSDSLWWCVDENSNFRVKYDSDPMERDKAALADGVPNFAFSLDPEQCRAFKLALQASKFKMDEDAKKAA